MKYLKIQNYSRQLISCPITFNRKKKQKINSEYYKLLKQISDKGINYMSN